MSNESIWRLHGPFTTYVMLSPWAGSTLALANGTEVEENALRVDNKSEKSMYSPLAAACASLSELLVDEIPVVVVVGESSFDESCASCLAARTGAGWGDVTRFFKSLCSI